MGGECFCGGVDCFLLLFQMTLFGLQIMIAWAPASSGILGKKRLLIREKSDRRGCIDAYYNGFI
jgi:hypothetical protein